MEFFFQDHLKNIKEVNVKDEQIKNSNIKEENDIEGDKKSLLIL